jgi:hypothetical protein
MRRAFQLMKILHLQLLSDKATASVCTELAPNEDQSLPKESLKARVYSLLREKTQMDLPSPPRLKTVFF